MNLPEEEQSIPSNLKISAAYQFDNGVLNIPGQTEVRCTGSFPIVSFVECPHEHKYTDDEQTKLLAEISDWLTSLGLQDERFFKVANDVIIGNTHGLMHPHVGKLGYKYSLLVGKFNTWFGILDDLFDETVASPRAVKYKFNDDESISFCEKFKSVWKNRCGLKTTQISEKSTGSVLHKALAAWRSIVNNIEEIKDPSASSQYFYESMDLYFTHVLVTSDVSQKISNNESMYRCARKFMSGIPPSLELSALLCNVSIEEVRGHQYFIPLVDAISDFSSWANDVLSLHKEYALGETFNLILIKIRQGYAASDAFNQTIRCAWDSEFAAMNYGKILMNDFPRNSKLPIFISIGFNLANGFLEIHNRMKRFGKNKGKVVPFGQPVDENFFRANLIQNGTLLGKQLI